MDPDLDLVIRRVIHAPRPAVWRAWTDPMLLAAWWLPAPLVCRVERLEVVPGGAFVTSYSEDGETFAPHVDACFLVVDEGCRIVFTNALDSAWRPARPEPVAITAEITLTDHPDGTEYVAVVRHADAASRQHHEDLGFAAAWGAVLEQLARLVE